KFAAYRQVADVGQARLQADPEGLRPAELHAVVFAGIVRGGDHHTRREVEFANGEIEFVGGSDAEIDGIHALVGDASYQGCRELRRREAHIAPDSDFRHLQIKGSRAPNTVRDIVGQRLAVDAADIVCAKNCGIDLNL